MIKFALCVGFTQQQVGDGGLVKHYSESLLHSEESVLGGSAG